MFQRFRSWEIAIIIALAIIIGAYSTIKKSDHRLVNREIKGTQAIQTLSTTLEITGAPTQRSWQLDVPTKSTALDVLNIASKQYKVPVVTKDYSFGTMVEEIDGVKADSTSNKYWTYFVNGQMASVGAGQYEVQNGDTITWKYGG